MPDSPSLIARVAASILSIPRNLLTGKDNVTHDLGKWSWAASFASLLVLTCWHEYSKVRVSVTEFATAVAAVVIAHGAALGLKSKTEPDPPTS